MLRPFLIVAVVLTFSGCQSPPPTLWQLRETKIWPDLRADVNECSLLAKGARANHQSNSVGRSLILRRIENAEARRDFKGCMEARGVALLIVADVRRG